MKKLSKWLLSLVAMSTAMSSTAASFNDERTDFRDETIYFAITTRFYDGDPKNNVLCWDGQGHQKANNDPAWRGDFKGLIEKLDYIKALGFTAIWITPVVQNGSGFDYHGYHAMDFSKVDLRYESRKEWGSSEDVKFQDLIDAAHAKDIKIILDIVLQHTGNFGENYFCHLFDRSQDIRNQARIEAALIPDSEKLGGQAYWSLPNDGSKTQYSERFKYMKNTDGQNHDSKNYWHHVGGGWNWDEKNRWWGQIAGDCVDLNTENPAVVDYIVDCYGKFIEMGVDGFRIDTTGHIAPLTFNSAFIPRFIELGEKYKSKRLNQAPFYMFGECCARLSQVIYRGQHVLSSHYYTWKSDPSLVSEWKTFTADWWANQVLLEGAPATGNMLTCEKDPGTAHNSNNVFMQNGAWHEPDYSQASGFNVIDFPMHYNFNNAGEAIRIANEGDNYYNDASWNVVYVDSHDYSPGPNDGVRFNGGTSQWAENLNLMFTFRGIPCIYYGSEVEFQAGKTIDQGPNLALIDTGRAYYGAYLEGTVSATDFGKYTASGNVSQTLNGDLAHHIRRLNMIRQAVPALRKGQYTFDGCSANGGYAFKRAYKDSYALVAINGGATFTGVPAGTYVDLVTGQSYQGGGTITVNAPQGQGQLRVLVKGWTGGKVGEDGKFMYTSSSVSHGGNPSFSDPGTTEYYTTDDAVGAASVKFSPAGGSFKTETLTVTAALNETATSGWFKVGNNAQQTLTPGTAKTFTIGQGMAYGETVTVTWSATSSTGENNQGTLTYKKVDPNATITIYVTGKDGADISGTNLHAWTADGDLFGGWPGLKLTETVEVSGRTFYYATIDEGDSVNIIFNRNGAQTDDITGITEDTYFEYDGGSNATKITNINVTPVPSMSFSPNGGSFVDKVTVNVTVSNATSAWYKIGNGNQVNINGNSASFTLGENMAANESVTVSWSASNASETKTGSVTFTKKEQQSTPDPVTGNVVYFDNSGSNWGTVYCYAWTTGDSDRNAAWPGVAMTKVDGNVYKYEATTTYKNVIFNPGGDNGKTGDLAWVNGHIYKADGSHSEYQGGNIDDPIITPDPVDGITIYYDNSVTNWSSVKVHHWSVNASEWPGVDMQPVGNNLYMYTIPAGSIGVVFNNGNGAQTVDVDNPIHMHIYKGSSNQQGGKYLVDDNGMHSGVDSIDFDDEDAPVEYYNLQGVRVLNPTPGIYIQRQGNKVRKIRVM